MAIEMAFLQRFGLLLGHPSYALSVVLASLLFGSGLGALVLLGRSSPAWGGCASWPTPSAAWCWPWCSSCPGRPSS